MTHPNRMPFEGVLTLVDVASDKAPNGARNHRVILTRAAALVALPTLLGMAIDYKAGWDGHDARQKCGIITDAGVVGNRLVVSGYIFARDFPDVEHRIRKAAPGVLGMSYELADTHVEDMRASIWTVIRTTFTGAAVLLREKAAYRNTSFGLKGMDSELALTASGDGLTLTSDVRESRKVQVGRKRRIPVAQA